MKLMKMIILGIVMIISIGTFSGCAISKEKVTDPITEKAFGDRSENMPTIALSDDEFTTTVLQKVTPISQDGNTLKSTAIAIKNGRVDKASELSKIDIMLNNLQDVRTYVSNLNISETKKVTKEALVKALDTYSSELTDYKNLLSRDSITTEELQSKIDLVISALEVVKQYAK